MVHDLLNTALLEFGKEKETTRQKKGKSKFSSSCFLLFKILFLNSIIMLHQVCVLFAIYWFQRNPCFCILKLPLFEKRGSFFDTGKAQQLCLCFVAFRLQSCAFVNRLSRCTYYLRLKILIPSLSRLRKEFRIQGFLFALLMKEGLV
jgi:hypothetical protein